MIVNTYSSSIKKSFIEITWQKYAVVSNQHHDVYQTRLDCRQSPVSMMAYNWQTTVHRLTFLSIREARSLRWRCLALNYLDFQSFDFERHLMKVITEKYLMKVITETYLMKVITETYLMKVITETYLMKVIPETRRAYYIWYLFF